MASNLFGPEMLESLKTNPETSKLLADPEFKAIIEEIKTDPASLGKHLSDPRVGKLFTALAASTAKSMPPSGEPSAPSSASRGAPPPPPTEPVPMEVEEEDLSQLPEEERNKKLALRAKNDGNVAYKARDFPTAIAKYTEAIKLDPNTISFLTNRAAAKLESGDAEGCIADCHMAIKENSDRSLRTDFKIIARAFSRMGNAYIKLDKFEEAIAAFEKSLIEASDSKVQRALADARREKKKRDEQAYIDPVLSKEEKDAGNVLFKAADFPGAIKKYTEAIKRNPADAIPYSNRAAAYMKLGEFPMALKDCERCLELKPDYVKAYVRKGNIHFYMKEYHKCLTVYEKGLEIDPNHRELREGLMKTQMRIQQQQGSGKVDEAQVQQAMRDPEIQAILSDPAINNILRQMEADPTFAAQAMRKPEVASKVQKLIAAGVLRTG